MLGSPCHPCCGTSPCACVAQQQIQCEFTGPDSTQITVVLTQSQYISGTGNNIAGQSSGTFSSDNTFWPNQAKYGVAGYSFYYHYTDPVLGPAPYSAESFTNCASWKGKDTDFFGLLHVEAFLELYRPGSSYQPGAAEPCYWMRWRYTDLYVENFSNQPVCNPVQRTYYSGYEGLPKTGPTYTGGYLTKGAEECFWNAPQFFPGYSFTYNARLTPNPQLGLAGMTLVDWE